MDKQQIELERIRAEKKSPVIVWLVNLVWPGLGNMVAGQIALGVVCGLLQWAAIGITFVTGGVGSLLLVVNWVVASAVGQSKINRDYARALSRLEVSSESPAP